VLENFGLGGYRVLAALLDLEGVDLAADRDAFDASFVAGAGASLTYGGSWDQCFLAVRPFEVVPCLAGYLVLDSFQVFEIAYFVASLVNRDFDLLESLVILLTVAVGWASH
jgi:hypothetical protein